MTELEDALENCLQAVERGASVDAALKRYPKLAADLGPLLHAASMARAASRVHVPLDVRRRGRSRLQQRAAEVEESRLSARRRIIPVLPRLALTSIIAAALVLTSTGLVSASSASLPGDQLYPVKRTWESVQLFFVFTPQQRDLMESSFEQERLDEISELLGRRQAESISFAGILGRQSAGQWVVSGIPVSVTSDTRLPAQAIAAGLPVIVSGITRPDGVVQAQQVQVLQPGASLPPLEPSENSDHEGQTHTEEGEAPATPASAPTPSATMQSSSGAGATHTTYQFSGVVQSMLGSTWRINGQVVHVDTAGISGQVTIGSLVRFTGYYNADGTFVVTSMEPQQSGSGSETKHEGEGGHGTEQPSGGEGESGGSEGP